MEHPDANVDNRPPPGRRSPGRGPRRAAGHWSEVLTRTLPGRLVLLLAAVGAIGLTTAAIGHFLLGAFPSFGESLWSATAHLVDPGSIGDDKTAAERAIGLVQVIAGIVFFAGVVLTVLTEVVDHALRRLRKGDPAVRRRDHLLIVGYNPSLPEVQGQLRGAGPVPPEIVVMLPLNQVGKRDEARRALAGYPARTTVVAADPGDDGYERVCARAARSIVVLSPEGEPDSADLTATDRAIVLERHLRDLGRDAPAVAVELRRGRNVQAFWYVGEPGAASLRPRFPANFDALVNDRNIGAMLTLAVMNPTFAPVFLADGQTAVGPVLIPSGSLGGLTFGEARSRIAGYTLLGALAGEGPEAKARYLPPDDQPLGEGDRLIVIPDEAARPDGPDPASPAGRIEFARSDPGQILMLGWSDASRALVEDLEASGADLGRLHLLDREAPASFGGAAIDPSWLIPGDPTSADDVAGAVGRIGPAIIWVAAPDGDPSAALVAGMLARQETDVPVVVEQPFADPGGQSHRVASGLTVVSTAGILAETIAVSLADPALLAAREQMFDPGLTVGTLSYAGADPLPLASLARMLWEIGIAPLAISSGEESPTHLLPGDRLLALHRVPRSA